MPQGKKVLIVEDEKDYLDMLVHAFEGSGLKLLGAEDSEEGLKRALNEHPDLILVDIRMPNGMDGITMVEKIREDEWGKNVKIIVLTNMDHLEHISRAAMVDVFEYLLKKDWKMKDLVEKIKKELEVEN